MTFQKRPNTPDNDGLMALVERMKTMEITRIEAAALANMPINSFSGWLKRRGLLEELKHTRRNAGKFNVQAETNPDKIKAYATAIGLARADPKLNLKKLATTGTFLNAQGTQTPYKDLVHYQVLARRVKLAREQAAQARLIQATEDTVTALTQALNTPV